VRRPRVTVERRVLRGAVPLRTRPAARGSFPDLVQIEF
jgi:hypothetical protein